ncbi:DNA mismatch repair endonuclease MutL [Salinigranum sp. GCM10025319]|uniref:DNA mismatch repair endonuclease MutL n=1 Tax=Salinigranum sp. GCM10025319 TaxID=3252687 RepID=UPI00360C4CDA
MSDAGDAEPGDAESDTGGDPSAGGADRRGDSTDRDSDGDADHGIRALDSATVQRIAAGEVVERPASVVKELVENSLDADASRVSVAVAGDGTGEIRVRDDGVGMTEAALRTAVEEHTTSKIRDIEDLEAGVGTLGFRGEALHTIGAVSRLTIRSKPRGGARGTELVYEGGEVVEVGPAGCPEGTVVEVCDLFFNTPARRKFLKTEATEFDHVNTVVTQYALANPDVAVSLDHDDREVFATEGRGNLQSAVLSVYGREVAESMIAVEGVGTGTADGNTPEIDVEGLVSDPETTRSTREYLSTFVNGRYVTSSTLREAVIDAYGGQLAPDRYPFTVLFVDLDPETVDVNVHPRKMEVRFDDERAVRKAVRESVESALLDHGLIRSSAPRGRSQAAETEITPESPGDEAVAEPDSRGGRTDGRRSASARNTTSASGSTSEPTADASGSTSEPTADASGSTTGDASDDADATTGAEPPADAGGSDTGEHAEADPESDREPRTPWRRREEVDEPHAEEADEAGDRSGATTASSGTLDSGQADLGSSRSTGTGDDPSEAGGDVATDPAEPTEAATGATNADRPAGVVGPETQRTLAGEAVDLDRTFDRLPRLRVLGQLHDTYVVAATDEGLVLVDQHAADERVNYERLKRELEGETPTQALAEPVELELTAREATLFDRYREALAQVGFHAGRVDDRHVEVRTVPAVFDATLDPDRLRDALAGFVADERDGGRETVDAAAEEFVADLACYPSITGNTSLTEGSVLELLEALDACQNPYACPHGRPTIVRVDREEIEDRFERDYPGHAGRREE